MQPFHTKGIVLRTVKYGETSVIATVYTELFGIQSYIVKGIRKVTKKSQGAANYFQPAAILDMIVYNNELKHLQFVKEFQWAYLYHSVLFDVVKNSDALYLVEMLQHSLKQPETNPELFYLVERTLMQLDVAGASLTANLPLYFTLQLSAELGFKIQGSYSSKTPVLDLKEGFFIADMPSHPYYLSNELAQHASSINNVSSFDELEDIKLNRNNRREMLHALQQYVVLHIADFKEMKSVTVLQEVLS
jgi:DNA repair protein RecO (recombination protein O)